MKAIEMLDVKEEAGLKELCQVEAKLNVKLPNDYKEFLLKYNGGRPAKDCFPLIDCLNDEEQNIDISTISLFYNVADDLINNIINENIAFRKSKAMFDLVTVGETVRGGRICICISGADYGKVYLCCCETDGTYDQNQPCDKKYLIASRFTDFINSLYVLEYDYVVDGEKKWISIHDRHSILLSSHVKRHGESVSQFFDNAPKEVNDYIIENIEISQDVVLWYKVNTERKKYLKRLDKDGKILEVLCYFI